MRVPRRRWVGLLAVLLVASCSRGEAQPQQLDVTQVARDTSAFQRAILADGKVTFAEYERAVLATVDCLKREGLQVTPPRPRDGDKRFLSYQISMEGKSGQDVGQIRGQVDAVTQKCDAEFSKDVSRVWEFQNLLTPEQRAKQRGQVADCLRGAGLSVPADAKDRQLFELAAANADKAAVQACRERYPDFFVTGVGEG